MNEKTGEVVFSLMLPYLEAMMDVCDIIIQRCKQLTTDVNFLPDSMKKGDFQLNHIFC